jgi:Na+/H+-dicarboxylate symporter
MKTWAVLVALALGLTAGVLLAPHATAWSMIVPITDGIGTIWINAIRMTVIPLVASITITGIAGGGDGTTLGHLGVIAFITLAVLLLGAGFFALIVAPSALGTLNLSPDAVAGLRASFASPGSIDPSKMPTLAQRLIGFVPSNIFAAAAEGSILPVVIVAVLVGFALRSLDAPRRQPLVDFFQAVGDATMIVVGWVLALAALGVFALGVGLGGRLGVGAAAAVVRYMAVMCLICFAYALLLFLSAIVVGRLPARAFTSAIAPAQAVALSTRSSFAALPAMITALRDKLGLSPSSTGFVLPLVVSVGRMNVPITWVVGVIFLGRLYGVDVPEARLVELVFVSTILSFSVPGIPSGSLLLFAPVLPSYGIPAEAIGILIAVDTIPDMFKTLLSVQGHLTTVAVVNRVARSPAGPAA